MREALAIKVPTGTPITGLTKEGEKIIPEEFIDLLPKDIQDDLDKVSFLASALLGKHSTYLEDFKLGTGKEVEKILGRLDEELLLEIS